MIYLNMTIVIVGAFLLSTLVVGIYFSRKKTTFREYAVGNKQFATATLVATVLATAYNGGTLIRNIECIYQLGSYWIMLTILDCCSYWFMSRLGLRMGPFMEHFSIAETIGSIYGRYPRIVAALFSILHCMIMVIIQINVMSQALKICLGSINPYTVTIFSTLLLIFYSIFGGVRSVTYTDVLQFITFAIIIPLLAWFMFIKIDKPVSEIIPILQSQTKFQFTKLFKFNAQMVGLLLLSLSFIVPYGSPGLMQRIYMSSGPIQVQRVFMYTTLFTFCIKSFIVLTALFTFAGALNLPIESVWGYITDHIPSLFKGFLAIGLLAMTISTADSALNACSVIFSNDITQTIQNKTKISDAYKLRMAKGTTLVVGLLSMLIAFKYRNLLKLLYWSLDCSRPIIAAPFILSVLGFRGTTRTALIGMTTGLLTILAWNKWIEPDTGINGAFIAMLANGLAMMAAHYLLKQPDGTGWVKPDHVFRQIQQEDSRKRAERKEAIQNAWANRKATLSQLITSDVTLYLIGIYTTTTAILSYWFIKPDCIYAALCQVVVGAFFIASKAFFGKILPNWFINLVALITLAVYLPLTLIGNWWDMVDPIFSLALSLTHCAVILWILPLYLAIGVVATTFLGGELIAFGWSFALFASLWPLFLAGLCIFAIMIYFKTKIDKLTRQNIYLKDQKKITASQQLKASLYEAALVPSTHLNSPKGYGSILAQVVRKVEESISFLDNHTPLYKEDFQTIIHKFYDWIAYFNSRETAKTHALLQPNKITLDKLIRTVEVTLSQEIEHPPKLLVKKIRLPSNPLGTDVVCDIHQVAYALVKIILRMGKLTQTIPPIVKVALHPTALQFKQADGIGNSSPVCIDFQAIALVISPSTMHHNDLPKIKACYHKIDCIDLKEETQAPPSIDLEQDTLSSVVRAHYGYLEASLDEKKLYILMVLPIDITDILHKMTARLPIDSLTREAPIAPKEQADSMMQLMQFHDHVCISSSEVDPIDVKTISSILLLLRKQFGFKRHISGQLFYVRAVGIAQLVVDWVFHSPKVVYAALLYGLVRRTCLPLSYIKEHYNLGVYAFVSNVIKIDKREELDHPSLLYVQNRLAQAIKEEHLQLSVLFIKLAERLYDLRHAAGYIHLSEVKHMAQETLNIDVHIAHTYLDPTIGQALEKAAKEALDLCILTEKDQNS
ncbi:sodium:solute symporter family transporter [Candidatus Cardinium hertigii]|uniref:sodium:solute symporter family transporter n=1 Tax=Candidatus Cardinium hertigii TaxID=247481 RepID=UPI003D7ED82B